MASPKQSSPRPLLRGEKPQDGSRRMNGKHAILVAILMLALPLLTWAQQDPEDQGKTWGNYDVHQSIEFGGHIADSEGNQQVYRTFVNIDSGPRLLSQELTMKSKTHQGVLFDDTYASSFGFGGDPEAMARLRMHKNKWYDFVGLYRRDENFFDYNLFANPLNLNPGSVTCGVGCTNAFNPTALSWYANSPHLQNTTRNMGDFTLTLLPESAVSVRLGYARNATHGRIDTTLEAPIRSLITEDSWWRSDRYQFGVDIKFIPRTTISGDVFFEHDKNDLNYVDNNLLYFLGNLTGPQVDPGIFVPPLSGSTPTCAGAGTVVINASGFFRINSGCNGVLLNTGPGGPYFKRGNVSSDIPTGQLSFQSSYFHNLDITGSGTYSHSSSDFLRFAEFIHGSNADLNTGSPASERFSGNADLGVTYHIGKNWSVSDKFRWLNWREAGGFVNTLFRCAIPSTAGTTLGTPTGFPAGAVIVTPLRNPCISDITALTGLTTAGNATTGTFEQLTTTNTVLGERSYYNTVTVNWQPSWHIGGYVGYRFARRDLRLGDLGIVGSPNFSGTIFNSSTTFTNNGTGLPPAAGVTTVSLGAVESEQINYHTVLAGVVVRPTQQWRINADLELLSADNFFTNISPRHQQRLRVYATYKPKDWLSFNGGVHLIETRNDFAPADVVDGTTTPLFSPAPYGHKDHWRWYTLGVGLNPNSKVTVDLGWTLLDQKILSDTCMPLPANAFTGLTAPSACGNGATARALLLRYKEMTNSGYATVLYHPIKRVTLDVGYEITEDNGATDWVRLDNGSLLMVTGDIFGNSPPLTGNPITPCPGASVAAGCVFPGPFADQPLGPQAINWHKAHAGITVEVVKGVEFRGMWSYYDYNSKDHDPALSQLQVTLPRDFHSNIGTLALRYYF